VPEAQGLLLLLLLWCCSYNEFEFINSCQGGQNSHLYNLQGVDPNPPQVMTCICRVLA